ncbi:MAG TPA: nucleotidyltransferase domain-containing protein [Thermoplasmatales archaeon]|nr:nucleotidyltransferase domain-containing protein [Thermoplasmatales archaeon]
MMNQKPIFSGGEHEIICNQLKHKGVKSIVLIGSRAKGGARKNSDYDIYVVVSAFVLPFIYKNIKKKEKILENELQTKVSIAPLTLNRIRRGNDLLLFKTKKEGITICGKDYLPSIKINRVEDIPADELFSYLFSSAYFLAEHLNPEKMPKTEDKEFIYNTAKSIMYCAETQLLMQGIYETEQDTMIRRVTEELDLEDSILANISLSHAVLNGNFLHVDDPNKFWFSAREYLILVFQQLAEKYLDVKNESLFNMIECFKNGKCSFIKNLQYSILVGINKKRFPISHLLTKKSVERYLCSALLYLILSVDSDLTIDEGDLNNSYQTLHSIGLSSNALEDTNKKRRWNAVKNQIQERWLMACGKNVIGGIL